MKKAFIENNAIYNINGKGKVFLKEPFKKTIKREWMIESASHFSYLSESALLVGNSSLSVLLSMMDLIKDQSSPLFSTITINNKGMFATNKIILMKDTSIKIDNPIQFILEKELIRLLSKKDKQSQCEIYIKINDTNKVIYGDFFTHDKPNFDYESP